MLEIGHEAYNFAKKGFHKVYTTEKSEKLFRTAVLQITCELLPLKSSLQEKQPFRGVFRRRLSENMLQIYKRTPIPKCDFNKVAKHGCSPVSLLHIFRTPIYKNQSGWLLLFTEENRQIKEIKNKSNDDF